MNEKLLRAKAALDLGVSTTAGQELKATGPARRGPSPQPPSLVMSGELAVLSWGTGTDPPQPQMAALVTTHRPSASPPEDCPPIIIGSNNNNIYRPNEPGVHVPIFGMV